MREVTANCCFATPAHPHQDETHLNTEKYNSETILLKNFNFKSNVQVKPDIFSQTSCGCVTHRVCTEYWNLIAVRTRESSQKTHRARLTFTHGID